MTTPDPVTSHLDSEGETAFPATSLVPKTVVVAEPTREAIEKLVERLRLLNIAKDLYTKDIDAHLVLISPIQQVPLDVLSNIFWQSLAIYREISPDERVVVQSITLSHVCQRWRNLALEMPELWSTLHAQPPPYPAWRLVTPGGLTSFADPKQIQEMFGRAPPPASRSDVEIWKIRVDEQVDALKTFILRSRELPLDLSFRAFDTIDHVNRTDVEYAHSLFVDALLGVANRWKSIRISLSSLGVKTQAIERLLKLTPSPNSLCPPPLSAPLLSSFSVSFASPRSAPPPHARTRSEDLEWNSVFQTGMTPLWGGSPQLTSLRFAIPLRTFDVAMTALPHARITDLTIDPSPQWANAAFHVRDALFMLFSFPNLERCEMRFHEWYTTHDRRRVGDLGGFQSTLDAVLMRNFGNRRPLFTPGVPSDPSMMCLTEEERSRLQMVERPRLREIVLRGGAQPRGLAAFLILPALSKLSLEYCMPVGGPLKVEHCGVVEWLELYGGQLTELTLVPTTMSSGALQRCMEVTDLPKVEGLKLLGYSRGHMEVSPLRMGASWDKDEQFWVQNVGLVGGGMLKALTPKEGLAERVWCPGLKKLVCYVAEMGHYTGEEVEKELVDLVAARRLCATNKIEDVLVRIGVPKCTDVTTELVRRGVFLESFSFEVEYTSSM